MTRRAWRLVKRRHAAHAFDGEGARLFGGRWNSPGVSAVYLSESVSLALLEVVVHANLSLARRYVVLPVTFEESLVEGLDRARLPRDWRRYPAPATVVALGDAWLRAGSAAILEVPSAVVPSESNFVVNPAHPGFQRLKIGPPEDLVVDARLRP